MRLENSCIGRMEQNGWELPQCSRPRWSQSRQFSRIRTTPNVAQGVRRIDLAALPGSEERSAMAMQRAPQQYTFNGLFCFSQQASNQTTRLCPRVAGGQADQTNRDTEILKKSASVFANCLLISRRPCSTSQIYARETSSFSANAL
jgi:hypothetical protein